MQETKVTVAEAMEDEEEEEGYMQVGTRFYRVTMRPTGGGGGAVARRRSLHYLESCYLCKESIACDRDVFMYKYVRAPSRHKSPLISSSQLLLPCSVRCINTRTPWPMAPWRAVCRCLGYGAPACAD